MLALWTLHAHAFECSPITPRLAITSPEKRCGKTTVLKLLNLLGAMAGVASNVSPPALFRTVEKARPTLLIDEAGSSCATTRNCAASSIPGMAAKARSPVVGDDHEPHVFSTWAPIAIAMIGTPPGTIADRSIFIPMQRRRRDELVERLRVDRPEPFATLVRKAAKWASGVAAGLAAADPSIPGGDRRPRGGQLAPLAGDRRRGRWGVAGKGPDVAAGMAESESAADTSVLADIQTIFATSPLAYKAPRVGPVIVDDALVSELNARHGSPWLEHNYGKGLTAYGLTRMLKPYRISSGTVRLDRLRTARGYKLSQFTDGFERYLSSIFVPTPSTSRRNGTGLGNSGFAPDPSAGTRKSM